MTKTIEKQIAVCRKVNLKTTEIKKKYLVEYKKEHYQVIEIAVWMKQAIDTVIWCSQCVIAEILVEKQTRILSIVSTDE